MAVAPPLPPLELSSAAFVRLECDHTQLFCSEYKRSNRTKGLKILRCFPHCCPEHVDRSYCGTSLSVRVQLVDRPARTAPPEPPPSASLAVFARFESVSDVSLRPGECVEVNKIEAGTQTDINLEGQWVSGVLDRPSGLVTTIRTPTSSPDQQKPQVFHLNANTSSRWYYDWESGANKAQRLMKHVLKAYVFERCAVDRDDNFTATTSQEALTQLYRVVDVVVSPEFTVISYRRAPSEQYQAALLASGALAPQMLRRNSLSAYEEMSYGRRQLDTPSGVYPRPLYSTTQSASASTNACSHHAIGWSGHGLSTMSDTATEFASPRSRSHQAKRQRLSPFASQPEATSGSDLLQDTLQWEHANAPAVAISKNLALVYYFLRWAPLHVYASFVDELVHLVHHKLLEPLAAVSQQASKINFFSRVLLEQAGVNEGRTGADATGGGPGHSATLPYDLEMLLRVVSQTTLWVFSKETRQWLRSFFQQHAASVLDKKALRASYLVFLRELEGRLDGQVFAATTLRNLSKVAEEVIAAVYSYEYFHNRRAYVREILSGSSFLGWNTFVAQMRDTYIGVSDSLAIQRHSGLSFDRTHPARNSIEAGWNAEWLLDMEDAIWKPSESMSNSEMDEDVLGLSLLTMFELISQMVRLEVAMDTQECTLSIRSTQGISGGLDCMRVVLDGKSRVFCLFPNGVTSGIEAGACGDYIGEMRVEDSNQLVVYLQIFNWTVHAQGPSYKVRTRIECWRNRRLSVSGDIMETTAPASFAPEETPYLGEMTLRGKRKAVEKAHARQNRGNRATSSSASAPWREHGRFRLSYYKV